MANKSENTRSKRTGVLPLQSVKPKKKPRILIAEDDDEMRSLLVWTLQKNNYEVTECTDGLTLLDYLGFSPSGTTTQLKDFDLIISDIRMPGITGLEVLEEIYQSKKKSPPMILITAFGDKETHNLAQRLQAAEIFDKPFEIEALLVKVHEILFSFKACDD